MTAPGGPMQPGENTASWEDATAALEGLRALAPEDQTREIERLLHNPNPGLRRP